MKMKRELTKEDGIKIREYRKKIQDKRTDRRMLAVQQRSEGKRNKDIAEILGVDPRIVSQWVRMYYHQCRYCPESCGGQAERSFSSCYG